VCIERENRFNCHRFHHLVQLQKKHMLVSEKEGSISKTEI
jgi:hypothetical protein